MVICNHEHVLCLFGNLLPENGLCNQGIHLRVLLDLPVARPKGASFHKENYLETSFYLFNVPLSGESGLRQWSLETSQQKGLPSSWSKAFTVRSILAGIAR